MIGAVILAAGCGERLGYPKGLLTVYGERLVRLHEARLREHCGAVATVLGCEAESVGRALEEPLPGVTRVINRGFERGPFSSLQTGLLALMGQHPELSACLVLPADTAPLLPTTVEALLLQLRPGTGAVIPSYGQRRGHPVVLSRALVELLLGLDKGSGRLDLVLRQTACTVLELDDPAVVTNLNTAADVESLDRAQEVGAPR